MCASGAPEGGTAPGPVLRGGGLEAPRPNGFEPKGFDLAFTFGDKVVSVGRQVEPDWVAVYALGGLSKDAGYTSLEQAAESVLTCMTGLAGVLQGVLRAQGPGLERAHRRRPRRLADHRRGAGRRPRGQREGDVATVIVVDTGAPGSYGLFVSVVPIGAPMLIGQQEQVAGSIRVP